MRNMCIKKELREAKNTILETFPVVLELLKDPNFITKVEEAGYVFDVESMFLIFVEILEWKNKKSYRR